MGRVELHRDMTEIDAGLWAVALHEAAHAVVYSAAGHEVVLVHSFIGRMSDGRTYGTTKILINGDAMMLRAVGALCGPLAEQRFTAKPWAKLAQDSARHDLAVAEDVLLRMGARPSLEAVIEAAQAAVERNWNDISTVARELARRRFLSGEAIAACLTR